MDEYVENILDHRFYQRLRYIKQLTSTNLVYPGANHTRFEHSIGVFHLAKKAIDNLMENDEFREGIDVDNLRKTVLSAALLHDIGHPPLSHIGENLLEREYMREKLEDLGFEGRLSEATLFGQDPLEEEGKHELLSCIIVYEKFPDALEAIGVEPWEVCSHFFGVSIMGEVDDIWQRKVGADLISSPMDVDRLDYIARDDYMTGANVANVDTDRMVASYTTSGSSLVLSDKALSVIRNYLEGRLSLYMWVNQHHKVVYADELLKRSVQSLVEEGGGNIISTETILDHCVDDTYVHDQLREWSSENPESRTKRLYDRYRSRDFLASCWKHRLDYEEKLDDSVPDFDEAASTNETAVEDELKDSLGLDRDDLWVATSNVPEYEPSELRKIHIKQGEERKRSVHDLGLYTHPDLIEETPYVYTIADNTDDVVETIREMT